MAQRKDASGPTGGGNAKSAGKGGGKSASGGVQAPGPGNSQLRGEKASPGGRGRGEVSRADRS